MVITLTPRQERVLSAQPGVSSALRQAHPAARPVLPSTSPLP